MQLQLSQYQQMVKTFVTSMRDFIFGLSRFQQWVLAGAALACIIIGLCLGLLAEGIWSDRALSAKSKKIATLMMESTAQGEQLQVATTTLKEESDRRERLGAKTAFLHFYVHFMTTKDATSKKTFVDHVCALMRQSKNHGIHMDVVGLEISANDLRSAGVHSVQKLLAANGLLTTATREQLRQIAETPTIRIRQRDPRVFGDAGAQRPDRALAKLNRALWDRKVRVTKTVTFFDSSSYDVPKAIAIAVHARPECALP